MKHPSKKSEDGLKIEQRQIADLSPYAQNSRTHDDFQVAQIAASILEFGFTNPVLIGAENDIIAGHGRVLAANSLGMKEVPVIVLGHLSAAQKRAYVIADNKLALNAGWDEELLKIELSGLRDDDGFDLDLTGFSGSEIDALFKDDADSSGNGDEIKSTFEVIADCENEEQQQMIYNMITKKGIQCRLSTF